MSPEQAEGRPVDCRSDIFSLGTVLYELLTGVSPFSRGYEPAAMYAVVHERAKPLRHFNPGIDEKYQLVIDRAMAKKPERRYQSMAAMAEDVRRVRDGRPLAEFTSGGVSDAARAVPSLAVMYFRNLGDRNDDYLAYGLTEDLIVDLSRVGDIRVTPMRTALKYKETELDIDEIADRLRVGQILDGSVRKTGDTVHVAAQLIDIETGQTIWSDRRDEPVNNLPQVKAAFSQELIRRLGAEAESDRAEAVTPTLYIPAAYEFFLRGKYAFEHRKDRTDVHAAMGLFRKALDLDPSLIAARAGIAHILIYNADYQQAEEVLNAMLSEARSRGLQNDQAVALHLLGRCQALVSRYDEAQANLRQAIQLSRKQEDLETELIARTHLLMTYRMLGRTDGTRDEYEKVVQLAHRLDDPARAIDAIGQMGWINLNVGKTTEARSLFDTGLALARESENRAGEANMLNSIAACYVGRMDRQSMRTELDYFRRAGEIWKDLGDERNATNTENNVGWVYRKQGQFREALRAFELATQWMGNQGKNKVYQSVGLTTMAETLCFLGEYDRSVETAEKAVAVAREIGHEPFLAFGQIALAKTRFLQGHQEEAIRTVEEAIGLAEKHSAEWEVISGRCALGEMLFEMGKRGQARTSLQQVTRTAKDAAYDEFLIRAFGYLSAIQTIDDGVGFGRARLHELVDRSADSYIHVIMMRLLGLCYIERPADHIDREEGRQLLRKALTSARHMSYKPEIDRIQVLLKRSN